MSVDLATGSLSDSKYKTDLTVEVWSKCGGLKLILVRVT